MGKSKGKNGEDKSENRKSGGRPWWARLFRWRLLLTVIIAAVIVWQLSTLRAWADSLFALLGWGTLLIVIVLLFIVGHLQWGKASSFLHKWNRWLAAFIFTLAIWSVWAFFGLGGAFGQSIIGQNVPGYPVVLSVLRLLGLIVLGIALVAPIFTLRLLVRFFSWLRGKLKRTRVPRPVPQFEHKKEVPPVAATKQLRLRPERQDEEEVEEPAPIAPARPPKTSPQRASHGQPDLKQVAQDVWKKFGESADLVTLNGWKLPPLDLLDKSPDVQFSDEDNVRRARLIEEALASYGVDASVTQINTGPTVTQFGLEPGWDRKLKDIKEKDKDGNVHIRQEELSKTRVKVDRITSLANDLALALAAPSIRIEAPIPGQSLVGLEVPNKVLGSVSLRGVMETNPFQKTMAKSRLTLALGNGAGGEAVVGDLAKMPHLLIAGATGSGKTVCLNAIICCLLMSNIPDEMRFILVDPKRVEMTPYNSIPHLATPVIVDPNKALEALRWLGQEMDRRYQVMAKATARNIEAYNKNRDWNEKMPYMVLVVDELADLMMTGSDETEHLLCRLAQLARATGIHLVVATQRPSVDVITGLIKANFPTRISFAVTSQVDSRTILDGVGAEKLLGRGDMLYMPTDAAKPKRLQGCYVSDAEIERLVYFWGSQHKDEAPSLNIEELISAAAASGKTSGPPADALLEAARKLAEEHGNISTSYLQRRLRIGYPRAARLMEQLQEVGAEGLKEGDEGEEE
ncbi:MAG: DNA translocase FtsK [Chloroflexi bacterium]|nr:DNA translocase FtsK [Chloroflexota bacterium]